MINATFKKSSLTYEGKISQNKYFSLTSLCNNIDEPVLYTLSIIVKSLL